MNHEDYCSYELSKKLKEKGFDRPCLYAYDENTCQIIPHNHVSLEDEIVKVDEMYHNHYPSDFFGINAPTLYQATKWLREVHKIYIEIFASISEKTWSFNLCHIDDIKFGMSIFQNNKSLKTYGFGTYEKALSAGITKALELI